MIKMNYDPILGVRYTIIDADPREEQQRILIEKAYKKIHQMENVRKKQFKNTKNIASK